MRSRPGKNQGRGGGFTLLELLIVILCIAVVAGGAILISADSHSQAQQNLAKNEIREVRAAILRFQQDTGFLPKTGPYAWEGEGQGRYFSPKGRAWFAASGWQARNEKLFTLAGEVDKKLGIATKSPRK